MGHHPSITFNHEGALWQQSAFSKNVSGWSPKPIQHKNYQVDSKNNNLGESNMIKEKVIKNPYLLGELVRVAKWKYLIPGNTNTYNLVLNVAWHYSTVGLVIYLIICTF